MVRYLLQLLFFSLIRPISAGNTEYGAELNVHDQSRVSIFYSKQARHAVAYGNRGQWIKAIVVCGA